VIRRKRLLAGSSKGEDWGSVLERESRWGGSGRLGNVVTESDRLTDGRRNMCQQADTGRSEAPDVLVAGTGPICIV